MEASNAREPHEVRLLEFFSSFVVDESGTLDRQGLLRLCEKLELEEKGEMIINSLLDETKTRVSFEEFRDTLVTLLDKVQVKTESSGTETTEKLPEREISPKFVFGKKKYGRRTRPKSDLAVAETNHDLDSESSVGVAAGVLKKSDINVVVNAQHPKKRRTALGDNIQTALPSAEGLLAVEDVKLEPAPEVMYGTASNNELVRLSTILDELPIGVDRFIDKTDLAIICNSVGMNKASRMVSARIFNNLNLDENKRVSYDVFYQLFVKSTQSNNFSDALGTDEIDEPQFKYEHSINFAQVRSGTPPPNDKMYSWEELETNLNGLVSTEVILHAWTRAGFTLGRARGMLQNLGFIDLQVRLQDLVEVLDLEISRLAPDETTVSARINFMTCTQALSRMELGYTKEKLEQALVENGKLRADLGEAKDRASMLASDVDDNYTRMESAHKNEVKRVERRHLEGVRQLTSTLSREREVMAQNIRDLEGRVGQLENLDMQRRAALSELRAELASAHTKTTVLTKQLAKAEARCETADREVAALAGLHVATQERRAEKNLAEMSELKETLHTMQNQNTSLRDTNDELTMLVESLSTQISTMTLKTGPSDKGARPRCLTDDLRAAVSASKRRGPPSPPAATSDDNSSDDEPLSVVQEKIRRCSVTADTKGMNGMQIRTLTPSGSIVNLVMVSPSESLLSGSPVGDSSGLPSSSDTDHSPVKTVEAGLRAENRRLKKRIRILTDKVDKRNEMIIENAEVCEAENNHRLKEFLEQGDFFPSPQLPYTVSQITEEYTSSTKELNEFENTKEQLEQHCRDLKSQLDEVKVEIVKILSERNACSKENCALKSHISDLKTSLGHSLSLEEPDNYYRVAFLSESPSLGTENMPASGEPSLELRSGVSEDCLVVKDLNEVNTKDDRALNSDESEKLFLLKCEFAEQLSVVEENHMKEKIELLERCTNLESSIEMLRQEYEKCEDYWASKLEEERVLYDKEQRTLDKKYKKILAELKEYDEYLSEDRPCTCRRLATIQESEKLESQVNALEEECEELRKQIANERTDRANEHQLLIEQLNQEQIRCAALEEQSYSKVPPRSAVVGDIGMMWRNADGNSQPVFGHRSLDDQSLGHNHYMTRAKTEPVQAFPGKLVHSVGVQWPDEDTMNGRQELGINTRRNPLSAGSADDLCTMLATRDLLSADISALRRQKELLTQSIQEEKNGKYGGGMGCGKQACCVDLTVLQTLNARWRQQEQQCRHLQNALKQRQRQTDMLLQHTWVQHKKEISDLEMVLEATQKTLQHQSLTCKEQVDRLVRNDVLVKDLYVENAYLVATVQRLEQRCQGLAQMTTDSISV